MGINKLCVLKNDCMYYIYSSSSLKYMWVAGSLAKLHSYGKYSARYRYAPCSLPTLKLGTTPPHTRSSTPSN